MKLSVMQFWNAANSDGYFIWPLGITLAAPLFKKASAIQIKSYKFIVTITVKKPLMEGVC